MFDQLQVEQLWVWFGTGKTQRYIPLYEIVSRLRPKHTSLPLFYAITGYDQVSFFAAKGKKICCKTWGKYDDLTTARQLVSFCPSKDYMANIFHLIERFVVLLYDSTSTSSSVKEWRKELFIKKGRLPDGIPPTTNALKLHIYMAIYQASYCCAPQSLCKIPSLPDSCEWGWEMKDKYCKIVWTSIPEAFKMWNEVIRCGCNHKKGCQGRSKCIQASLPCTAFFKCGGHCESWLFFILFLVLQEIV